MHRSRDFPMRPCPPERIVLCVDACEDWNAPKFPMQQGGKHLSSYAVIKKCAEAFLSTKTAMNPNHQFAVMIFKANTQYMTPFDNKVTNIVKQLQSTVPNAPPDQPTNLARIFKLVHEKVFEHADEEAGEHLQPLRIVILYGRPGVCTMDENVLSEYVNVVTDVLFIHKPILSAKEKKRVSTNFSVLQSCLSEKSLCGVALSDSYLALKHVMRFLIHPALRE